MLAPPRLHTRWACVIDADLAVEDLSSWQDATVLPYGILVSGVIANTTVYWLILAIPVAIWKYVRSLRIPAEQRDERER